MCYGLGVLLFSINAPQLKTAYLLLSRVWPQAKANCSSPLSIVEAICKRKRTHPKTVAVASTRSGKLGMAALPLVHNCLIPPRARKRDRREGLARVCLHVAVPWMRMQVCSWIKLYSMRTQHNQAKHFFLARQKYVQIKEAKNT